MKPYRSSSHLRLLNIVVTLLLGLFVVSAWARGSIAVFAGPFGSPLRPTATVQLRVTPGPGARVTATATAFISPLNTPPPDEPFARPYYGPPTPDPYIPTPIPTSRPASYPIGNHHIFLPLTMKSPTYLSYGAKGIGDRWQEWVPPSSGTNLSALDYAWYHDWRFNFLPERDLDPEYARTVFCREIKETGLHGVERSISDMAQKDYNAGLRGRVWLIYNEPDSLNQCPYYLGNGTGAAIHFSDVYDMIKSNDPWARVFGGGLVYLDQQETHQWWQDFVDELGTRNELQKLEGIHLHLYPYASARAPDPYCLTESCIRQNLIDLAWVASDWYQREIVDLGLQDRPIWISETGWIHYEQYTPSWVRDHIMAPLSQWFARDPAWPYVNEAPLNPGYDAIAWFVTHESSFPGTRLLDHSGPDSPPTTLGEFWNTYHP